MKEVLAVVAPALDENLGSAPRYAFSLAGHMIAHVTILVAEIELEVVAPVKERVVVAWYGTPAAVRALHDAIPLLAQAQEVIVVSVTGDKEFTAGETGPHVVVILAVGT